MSADVRRRVFASPERAMAPRRRAVITVAGRVQGVFFRSATRKEAKRLGLAGFAENLSDGRVRIVAEGLEPNLTALLRWCKDGGTPLASVRDVTLEWQPPTGTFNDFSIR